MRTVSLALGVAIAGLCPAASNAQSGPSPSASYALFDLSAGNPTLGLMPYGISPNGKITGVAVVLATSEIHAFLWQNGVVQDLGMLGYPYGADGDAINNSGQLAATGYGPGYKALLWSNGHVTKLGSIDGGSSDGYSINSLGHIVGRAINGDGGLQGFSYINGQFTALSVDVARGINDSDEYVGSVGYYWTYGGYIHAVEHGFLNSGGVQTDLGDLGGGVKTITEAFAINNAGRVTGYSTLADGTIHAFLWGAGEMSDLGTFPPYFTKGVAVNGSSQVVGNIETWVGGQVGAFLYTSGVLSDLSTLLGPAGADWSQLTVNGISDDGWIAGYGTLGGETHGFVAKPIWPDLGSGLPGVNGVPKLLGTGTLQPGSTGSLVLTTARPSSAAMLFVSLSSAPAPFKGGTLVPFPTLLTVPLVTLADGTLTLPFVWPAGVPSATSFWFQYAIGDVAAIQKVSLSNAIVGTTP
jgi:probable HAF family extracellular repeat protein